MNQVSNTIKTFFEGFERASNSFDQDLLASQFSDPFMAAEPHGRYLTHEDLMKIMQEHGLL